MTANDDAARFLGAARSMIGCPFMLHGRNPQTGLDCVGLIAASLDAIGRPPVAPAGYRLRNRTIAIWLGCAAASGFEAHEERSIAGDVLLVSPSSGQHHLLIQDVEGEVIHAHAGLRRVVRQPCPAEFSVLKKWRLGPHSGD